MRNQSIVVLVDGQAAIKAFIKCTVTSITVFNCIRNLNQLGKQYHVSIAWIPGHAGVHGYEVADYVAKSGSISKMHGPEPFVTVPYASSLSTVKDWSTDRWKPMWNERKDCLRMKESVGWTSSRLTIRLLNLQKDPVHLPEKHLPEWTFPRKSYFPEWTLTRMYVRPNGHFLEKLFSGMDTCQNVHLAE